MRTILEVALLLLGFLLGLFYAANTLLPVFYGVPKALLAYFRGQIFFKPVLLYLIAPVLWTVSFLVVFVGLAVFWNSAFEYLRESAAFNSGNALGGLALVANALLNKKTQADMRMEFDDFVLPYRKSALGHSL
jgi:hypothetical protein